MFNSDQTALMQKQGWFFAVRIWHKDHIALVVSLIAIQIMTGMDIILLLYKIVKKTIKNILLSLTYKNFVGVFTGW